MGHHGEMAIKRAEEIVRRARMLEKTVTIIRKSACISRYRPLLTDEALAELDYTVHASRQARAIAVKSLNGVRATAQAVDVFSASVDPTAAVYRALYAPVGAPPGGEHAIWAEICSLPAMQAGDDDLGPVL